MEPSPRTKVRVLIFGLLIPFAVVVAIYYGLISAFWYAMFHQIALRTEFSRDFLQQTPIDGDRPISIAIFGDSTAKSALRPESMISLNAVNLAMNGGSVMTAYHQMLTYLEQRPAPNCVLIATQLNWHHNFQIFFSKVLFEHSLTTEDIQRIWAIGEAKKIFPADEMNAATYYFKSVRSWFALNALPLKELQEAMFVGPQLDKWAQTRERMMVWRGFQPNNPKTIVPEEKFFTAETHSSYLGSFDASSTEDAYIQMFGELAKEKKFRLIFAILPVAQSDYVSRSAAFLRRRDAHLRGALSKIPGTLIIKQRKTMPRALFYDFTHLNTAGAKKYTTEILPTLESNCLIPNAPFAPPARDADRDGEPADEPESPETRR